MYDSMVNLKPWRYSFRSPIDTIWGWRLFRDKEDGIVEIAHVNNTATVSGISVVVRITIICEYGKT